MTQSETQDLIIDCIRDRKGRGITVLDLSEIPGASASEFIICEGTSTTQVGSIADHLRRRMLEDGSLKPYNLDGARENSEWTVLDYGDIWIHIFMTDARMRYNLEELWSDAKITEIPDLD